MGNMKVAEARARFGEILDAAEKGLPVVIERRGVRFRLVADVAERATTAGRRHLRFRRPRRDGRAVDVAGQRRARRAVRAAAQTPVILLDTHAAIWW